MKVDQDKPHENVHITRDLQPIYVSVATCIKIIMGLVHFKKIRLLEYGFCKKLPQSDGKSVQLMSWGSFGRKEVTSYNGFYVSQKLFLDDKKINLRKKMWRAFLWWKHLVKFRWVHVKLFKGLRLSILANFQKIFWI